MKAKQGEERENLKILTYAHSYNYLYLTTTSGPLLGDPHLILILGVDTTKALIKRVFQLRNA